ncbi:hypothetical protein [Tsukamurella sp. NPDC003166]|uniref:hypothetical protein n=1 Tax=Tsukamurella sp. NPDC003166 TaxID=3154444 RepID=UPI0033AD30D7
MSLAAPALIAASAGVGFGHAVMPDHWVPLSVIARTQRYPLRRVLRLSAVAGVAHVALSLLLGAAVIAIGLQFRSIVERNQTLIVGSLLILTGLVFLVMEVLGRGHSHGHDEHGGHVHGDGRHAHAHDHEGQGRDGRHAHDHGGRTAQLMAFVIPFGAAASPDLTILPVFLAASGLGVVAATGTLVAFSVVTIGTIVGLTMLGAIAGYQLRGAWIDKGANLITAAVLLVVGVLVAAGIV